jgi:hypothetical protein
MTTIPPNTARIDAPEIDLQKIEAEAHRLRAEAVRAFVQAGWRGLGARLRGRRDGEPRAV